MSRLNNRMKRIEKILNKEDNTSRKIDITKQAEALQRYFDGVPYEKAGFQEVKNKLTPKQQAYQDDIFKKYLSN